MEEEKSISIMKAGEEEKEQKNGDGYAKREGEAEAVTKESAPSEAAKGDNVSDAPAERGSSNFTSEIYKVCVRNLPRTKADDFRKFLRRNNLDFVKIKRQPNWDYAYVTFASQEAKQQGLYVLNGGTWKGKTLSAYHAPASVDPYLKRQREGDEQRGGDNKRARGGNRRETEEQKVAREAKEAEEAKLPIGERLNNAVTPCWKLPYEEQLEKKYKDMLTVMKRLEREILKANKTSKLLKNERNPETKLLFELQKVKASPVLTKYRNKCEFAIGVSADGKDKTVGFMLGMYKEGHITVAEPSDCLVVPDKVNKIREVFQDYFQNVSSLSAFDKVEKKGCWRQLVVRYSPAYDQCVATVQLNSEELSKEVLDKEQAQLTDFLTAQDAKNKYSLMGCLFQAGQQRSVRNDEEAKLCFGDQYLYDKLFDLEFRVSPGAFFQVNSPGAQVLYGVVRDWCMATKDSHVVDVCCGTGTIGLTMAAAAGYVTGVEMCAPAIEDAIFNAKKNGLEDKCRFICGKAEDVLPKLVPSNYGSGNGELASADVNGENKFASMKEGETLKQVGSELIGILDPPRAGVHSSVIKTVRRTSAMRRLIYVSCSPKSAVENLVSLCRATSKNYTGNPFTPVCAIPVDMFPHTDHCELAILLTRD